MRAIVCVFIFIAVVCVGLSREISKAITRPAPDTHTAAAAGNVPIRQASPARETPAPRQVASGRTVRLDGDQRGHFRVEARVDGRAIDFMVDTGASAVVLRESSAAKLGIFPKPSDYTGRTSTANGVARYAPVQLSRVEVNGINVYDVRAAVMPDNALNVNLLGMTFLSKIKFSHDRGRLVLEQ
jgi:aspartyl protease family protein